MLLSIITPIFNEEKNIQVLFEGLRFALEAAGIQWEWIVVDDHSEDESFAILKKLAQQNNKVKVFRLSRNSGSHLATTCGLHHASGDCAIVMSGDLQDSPDIINALVSRWRDGYKIVWAARRLRPSEKKRALFFGKIYYFIMRKIVGIQNIPATGADCFLVDKIIVESLKRFQEKNISLLALIAWMGFNQTTVLYDKRPRKHGKSKWTLAKKIKLVVDSITSFSYLPIRLMSYLGFCVALMGFGYVAYILYHALNGTPPEGWTSLIVVSLVTGGTLMMMMGVIGEYVWRALDESRRRPAYLVEEMISGPSALFENTSPHSISLCQ